MESIDFEIVKAYKQAYTNEVGVLPVIEGSEVLYNGPMGQLAVPRTMEASIKLTSQTIWCMSWTDPVDHDFYKHDSNVYIWTSADGVVNGLYVDPLTGRGKFLTQHSNNFYGIEHQLAVRETPALKLLFDMIEDYISRDAQKAYNYVLSVIKDRWPKGESVIFTDPVLTKKYLSFVRRREGSLPRHFANEPGPEKLEGYIDYLNREKRS